MKPQERISTSRQSRRESPTAGYDLPPLPAVFGPDVLTAASRIDTDPGKLPAIEQASVAAARVSRQREFATGRRIARSLMTRLGITDAQLPANDDRSPQWPAGVVGSISHAENVCVVALAPSEKFLGLGVDIEPNRPIESRLIETICTKQERAWLAHQPPATRGVYARLMFSARECAFKCQYPFTKTFLEYEDVCIELDVRRARFVAAIHPVATRKAETDVLLYGRFCIFPDWLVTGIALHNITFVTSQY
jgi:4'-phosphopantetheinyl transferase EntD